MYGNPDHLDDIACSMSSSRAVEYTIIEHVAGRLEKNGNGGDGGGGASCR